MENKKINITELLKDCPPGMELYSPIFGDVYLNKIRPHLAIVVTIDKAQDDFKEEFLYDGRYWINGECMLFPSKDKTNWEGFVPPCKFKDGDILYLESDNHDSTLDSWILIYKENENEEWIYKYVALKNHYTNNNNIVHHKGPICNKKDISIIRFATEEEKRKLFDAIKENGYCWNEETKTLEKLIVPKFKVGDKIVHCERGGKKLTIDGVYKTLYGTKELDYGIPIENQDEYELVPDKFDISTLIPFETKVLVRQTNDEIWKPAIFGCYNGSFYYVLGNVYWKYCIPYEGNEHLCGKTDDCNEFYKTWED